MKTYCEHSGVELEKEVQAIIKQDQHDYLVKLLNQKIKAQETALGIAKDALDEIQQMTISGVRSDQEDGLFYDWKDEARSALKKINKEIGDEAK